jgi:hypothetical protein
LLGDVCVAHPSSAASMCREWAAQVEGRVPAWERGKFEGWPGAPRLVIVLASVTLTSQFCYYVLFLFFVEETDT